MERRAALWVDLAVKAALVGLLLFAVARPDLPQFEGKATDTLGDRALGLAGWILAAALTVTVLWRRPQGRDESSPQRHEGVTHPRARGA